MTFRPQKRNKPSNIDTHDTVFYIPSHLQEFFHQQRCNLSGLWQSPGTCQQSLAPSLHSEIVDIPCQVCDFWNHGSIFQLQTLPAYMHQESSKKNRACQLKYYGAPPPRPQPPFRSDLEAPVALAGPPWGRSWNYHWALWAKHSMEEIYGNDMEMTW